MAQDTDNTMAMDNPDQPKTAISSMPEEKNAHIPWTASECPPPSAPPSPGKSKQPWTWTRKRLALLVLIVVVAMVIIVLVITLPVVLLRRGSRDDPSYHIEANRPRRVLGNFPDPGLLRVNNTWYAYGTNAETNVTEVSNVPLAISHDFTNWTKLADHDVLPTEGDWEANVNHWAPDAIQRDDGKFVLYYSGELKNWTRHHCVGAAVSNTTNPLGPYKPQNTPVACPRKKGGAIDPSPFKDIDGTLYVTYKADGNSVGNGGKCNNSKKPLVSVPIMLQQIEKDGVTPVNDPIKILEHDNNSDGPLIESPSLIRTAEGVYYLFFSSHCFTSPKYDIKYASSLSLKGPYVRAKQSLLRSGDFGLNSPGGATVSPDGTKMVFHANCDQVRCMYVAGIHINSTVTLSAL